MTQLARQFFTDPAVLKRRLDRVSIEQLERRLSDLLSDLVTPARFRLCVRSGHAVYPNHGRSKGDLLHRALACVESPRDAEAAA